jgi:hypothetical protein
MFTFLVSATQARAKSTFLRRRYSYGRFCYHRWLGIRGVIVGREDIQTQASMVFYTLPEFHL